MLNQEISSDIKMTALSGARAQSVKKEAGEITQKNACDVKWWEIISSAVGL